MREILRFLIVCLVLLILPVFGECPSTDVTGDCRVNLEDLAAMAGQWLAGDGIGNDMIIIPGGTFEMGNAFVIDYVDNDRPVHSVTLDSFYMGKYEITNRQYCAFLNAIQTKVVSGTVYHASDAGNLYPYFKTPAPYVYSQIHYTEGAADGARYTVRLKGRTDMSNDPVVYVSWFGAVAYCNWRSQREGRQPCYNLSTWTCDFEKNGYRLPTEAEWEYAARGGLSGKRFPWGDTIQHSQANYYACNCYDYDISPTTGWPPTWNDGIRPVTSPVGSYLPNGFGLYDMAGNAFEWCHDWYADNYYSVSPNTNPTGPASGFIRVLRGGSWDYDAFTCRVAYRERTVPDDLESIYGFRLVLGSD